METRTPKRWHIAAAAIVMQLALGAVYAWSVFRTPLMQQFGWSIAQVTLTFSITIFTLGFAAFGGGLWMEKVGPRRVGMTGGVLYGLGVCLASLSYHGVWVLYLTYGVLAGIGIGLGYIVPVATLVKWFPEKRGMMTGIAVAGFGAGALLTAPIATILLLSIGVLPTFATLGAVYLILVAGAASLMTNPPQGYLPSGWQPTQLQQRQWTSRDLSLGEALHTWQWYALWGLLFLNVTAGISLISQAAPMAQEITNVSATAAAGLIGVISIANSVGRLLWAGLSDIIGRKWVFLLMFLIQTVIFFTLPLTTSFVLMTTLASIVLLCYGGGFGTMPAFTADYFGPNNIGPIYGLMLTAWSCGGVLGPVLIAAIRQETGAYTTALYIMGGIMLVSTLVPLFIRSPQARELKRPATMIPWR